MAHPERIAPLVAEAHDFRQCEVAIIGAVTTGALLADTLTGEGREVVVVDRRDVASGSTRASTALLQYEVDVPLVALGKQIGVENAARACRASARSIDLVGERVASLRGGCCFQPNQSVDVASSKRDAHHLPAECGAREDAGLGVELWNDSDIGAGISFTARAALRSTKAEEVDPYQLTRALVARAVQRGGQVFDRMPEVEITPDGATVRVQCGEVSVTADWVVVAAGYEAVKFLPKRVVTLKSSFALVS